jgi:hypothetical protein
MRALGRSGEPMATEAEAADGDSGASEGPGDEALGVARSNEGEGVETGMGDRGSWCEGG